MYMSDSFTFPQNSSLFESNAYAMFSTGHPAKHSAYIYLILRHIFYYIVMLIKSVFFDYKKTEKLTVEPVIFIF